jgi:GxxExxY protein
MRPRAGPSIEGEATRRANGGRRYPLNHEGHEGHEAISAATEDIAKTLIDAGLKVHKALGPGLHESAYEVCLAHELQSRGVAVRRQLGLPIVFDGVRLDAGYRLDLLVAEQVIVEVKAVDALTPLHEAQLLTYLKLSSFGSAF